MSKLFIFDLKGNLITSIGSKGAGPGEFVKAFRFYIENNEIFVIDLGGRRVQVFDLSGNFKRTVRFTHFPVLQAAPVQKTIFYTSSEVGSGGSEKVVLYRKTEKGEEAIEEIPFEVFSKSKYLFPPANYPILVKVLNMLLLVDFGNGLVKIYKEDGKLLRKFSVVLPRYSISKQWKEEFIKSKQKIFRDVESPGG